MKTILISLALFVALIALNVAAQNTLKISVFNNATTCGGPTIDFQAKAFCGINPGNTSQSISIVCSGGNLTAMVHGNKQCSLPLEQVPVTANTCSQGIIPDETTQKGFKFSCSAITPPQGSVPMDVFLGTGCSATSNVGTAYVPINTCTWVENAFIKVMGCVNQTNGVVANVYTDPTCSTTPTATIKGSSNLCTAFGTRSVNAHCQIPPPPQPNGPLKVSVFNDNVTCSAPEIDFQANAFCGINPANPSQSISVVCSGGNVAVWAHNNAQCTLPLAPQSYSAGTCASGIIPDEKVTKGFKFTCGAITPPSGSIPIDMFLGAGCNPTAKVGTTYVQINTCTWVESAFMKITSCVNQTSNGVAATVYSDPTCSTKAGTITGTSNLCTPFFTRSAIAHCQTNPPPPKPSSGVRVTVAVSTIAAVVSFMVFMLM